MSPVKDVHLMSDEEIVKVFGEAYNHVKQVHNIDKDHEEFDKFLAMHPYYADVIAEYKKRNLGTPKSSPNPDDTEPPKPEKPQDKIPEGYGQDIPTEGSDVSDHEQGEGQQ